MKLSNMTIIFCIIAFTLVTIYDIKTNNLTVMAQKKVEYNKALDSAVDDAILELVEVDSKQQVLLNRTTGIEKFFYSLYANFGVMDNPRKQETIKSYIPIIAVTYTDGYYILYKDEFTNEDGTIVLKEIWTEKQPYVYEDDNLIYNFTLADDIKIYDKNTNQVYEGKYHDLKNQFTYDSILDDEDIFDTIRRNSIINLLTEDMNYYIYNYNNIANQFGITYNFALPTIDQEDWYRTIDDISLIVLFQGYPYGFGVKDTYNRYSLAAARIKKKNAYYIEQNINDGLPYYHRADCNELHTADQAYYSKKECALEGAYPCLECNP